MNQTTLWIFSWILLWGTSCQPSRLEQALTLARENREELEQVLEHYKEDPEKLKAARFLIENMPGHHSCVGEEVKRYYDQIDSICTLPATVQEQKVMIEKASARVDPSKLKYVADVRVLTAQFLIAHIDQAFRQWKELGWNNHLLFDDFCEYLLPYKSTEGEYPELWSIALQSVHSGDLDNMHACDYFKKSSFWVCKEVNDTMPRRSLIKYNALPILRLTTLVRMPFSRSCDEHTLMTQALMRSKGIPVATDYTVGRA